VPAAIGAQSLRCTGWRIQLRRRHLGCARSPCLRTGDSSPSSYPTRSGHGSARSRTLPTPFQPEVVGQASRSIGGNVPRRKNFGSLRGLGRRNRGGNLETDGDGQRFAGRCNALSLSSSRFQPLWSEMTYSTRPTERPSRIKANDLHASRSFRELFHGFVSTSLDMPRCSQSNNNKIVFKNCFDLSSSDRLCPFGGLEGCPLPMRGRDIRRTGSDLTADAGDLSAQAAVRCT